jgi:hypothetical protein
MSVPFDLVVDQYNLRNFPSHVCLVTLSGCKMKKGMWTSIGNHWVGTEVSETASHGAVKKADSRHDSFRYPTVNEARMFSQDT